MTQFSLIVPTINRVNEVIRLLESLRLQTYKDFEVVVVDQNTDERLIPVIEQFSSDLCMTHIRSQTSGASKARNIGIHHTRGQILIWPDDDCWFPPNLLENIASSFENNRDVSGLLGILIDATGKPHSRWYHRQTTRATFLSALMMGAEPLLFFRREMVENLGGFDETIGVGAQTSWGAGEGTDLCIRALHNQEVLIIDPSLKVCHALAPILTNDPSQNKKTYGYARGMGAVLKKNHLPISTIALYVLSYIRAILWACISLKRSHIEFHILRLKGVIEGWYRYKEYLWSALRKSQ
jgi:glycosyltransferase involved in cell wall biosynthesis